MYCIGLSRRLKRTIHETLELSVSELNLQMAYDITQDKGFQERQTETALSNEWETLGKEGQSALAKLMIQGMKKK